MITLDRTHPLYPLVTGTNWTIFLDWVRSDPHRSYTGFSAGCPMACYIRDIAKLYDLGTEDQIGVGKYTLSLGNDIFSWPQESWVQSIIEIVDSTDSAHIVGSYLYPMFFYTLGHNHAK